MTRNAPDSKAIQKVEAALWVPPRGHAPEGPWSPEQEMKAFRTVRELMGR